MHTEIRTAASCIHATVELDSGIWIFEFELDAGAEEAAPARIWAKDCAGPYRAAGKSVYLVGIGFDSEQRNVDEWKMEILETVARKETARMEEEGESNA